MGRLHFRPVGVVVRRAAKTQPYERYHTTSAILIGPFGKVYSAPAQIEHELLTLIGRGQGNRDAAAEARVVPFSVIDSAFLQREQPVRFRLG